MANRRRNQLKPATKPTPEPVPAIDANRAKWVQRALIALAILGVVIFTVRLVVATKDPTVPLLVTEHGAKWVIHDQPFELIGRKPGDTHSIFRTQIDVSQQPPSAVLNVRGFRLTRVALDNREILPGNTDLQSWRTIRTVDLGPMLAQGSHQLEIAVININAPAALQAWCDELNLRTNSIWQTSSGDGTWSQARLADARREAEISREFPPAEGGLMRSLPLLLPAFGLMAFWYWASHAPERFRWAARRPSPAVACWLLMGALLVLALNNIWKLPPYVGFDVNGHLAYMLFIIHNGRLPLAHEGWQMFQSPLYYLLSLPLAESMVNSMDLENLKKLLRIIPLLCGIAQVAVCYSAVRMVFPARRDLQICGTIVGGLLPMNIYISQYIGNEPLAGVLTSLTICMALAVVYGSARCRSRWWIALLGAVYGLALLAKVTPIVLAPILVGWLIVMPWLRAESALVGLKRAGLMCVIAGLCCGWYYWRNYAEFGRFFIGGWDSARSIEWWQDPGYRTLGELSRFGQSLRHPIYASVSGLWDSLYSTMWTDGSISSSARYKGSPPWNESFLVGGVLLSIVPQVLMLCGAAAGCIWKLMPNRGAIVLCVICVGAYLAAITGLYLKVPIYSTAKATYALGLLPCFAILVTAGLEVVARTIASRAFLYGLIAAWAVGAYATFFIVL